MDESELALEEQVEILARYAPILRFSAGERFFPTKVEAYRRACKAFHPDGLQFGPDGSPGAYPDKAGSYLRFLDGGTPPAFRLPQLFGQDPVAFWVALAVFVLYFISSAILILSLTTLPAVLALAAGLLLSLLLASLYFALSANIAGVFIQLRSGQSLIWAEKAYDKYRDEIAKVEDCTIYGRIVSDGHWTVLQYFFFYPFNDWRSYGGMNLHEGDWESVMVYVPGDVEEARMGLRPFGVAYSQHHGKEFLLWQHARHIEKADKKGFHAVTYVALGSHANYPFEDSRIELARMERFGMLRDLIARVEMQARRVGLFGGRVPADIADGLGPHINALEPDEGVAVERYLKVLDGSRPEEQRFGPFKGIRWIGDGPAGLKWDLLPISEEMAWVKYQGLWGDRTAVSGESGPTGPRWQRAAEGEQKERQEWGDPLGWVEERSPDVDEVEHLRRLREKVNEMWRLEDLSQPEITMDQLPIDHDRQDGIEAGDDSVDNLRELLEDSGRSLGLTSNSKNAGWSILIKLAQLQVKLLAEGATSQIPVILPFVAEKLPSPNGSATSRVVKAKQVSYLIEQLADELSAIYGFSVAYFRDWLNTVQFGETEGDELDVLLFVEVDTSGLAGREYEEWAEVFRVFASNKSVIVSLSPERPMELGLGRTLVLPSPALDEDPLKELEDSLGADVKPQKLDELSWFVGQMMAHRQRLFLIDRLQPTWLTATYRKLYYGLETGVLGLFVLLLAWWVAIVSVPLFFTEPEPADEIFLFPFGPMFGLATAVMAWLAAHRRFSIVSSLVVGVAYALATSIGVLLVVDAGYRMPPAISPVSGLLFGGAVSVAFHIYGLGWGQEKPVDWRMIETYRKRGISWRRALRGVAAGALFGFVLLTLVNEEGFQLIRRFFRELFGFRLAAGSFTPLMAFGVWGVLGLALYIGVLYGTGHGGHERAGYSKPGTRIREAGLNGVRCGLVGGAFIGIPFAMVDPLFGLSLGTLGGSLVAIGAGGLIVLQHAVLRFLLMISPTAPSNLAKMLHMAEEKKVLVRRGNGYELASYTLREGRQHGHL